MRAIYLTKQELEKKSNDELFEIAYEVALELPHSLTKIEIIDEIIKFQLLIKEESSHTNF